MEIEVEAVRGLPASASASSSRSPSASGSYSSKAGSSQYVSKVAENFSSSVGVVTALRRTFHSRPLISAERERFELPT